MRHIRATSAEPGLTSTLFSIWHAQSAVQNRQLRSGEEPEINKWVRPNRLNHGWKVGVRHIHTRPFKLGVYEGSTYPGKQGVLELARRSSLISQKVFVKLFCKSQCPHEFVKLSSLNTDVKNAVTDLCGK